MNRNRTIWPTILAGMLACLGAARVPAADLRFIDVDREKDRYSLRSVTWFKADPESLYGVLTDYNLFPKFTSAIVEAKNMGPDEEGRPEFYTRMEGCVMFWCQSFVRMGHLRLDPLKEIVAITDPERSNFKLATERWQLRPEQGGTLLIYEFDMEPDFWVPPVLGPFHIKRTLRSGGERAAERIEALALGEAPIPTD